MVWRQQNHNEILRWMPFISAVKFLVTVDSHRKKRLPPKNKTFHPS